jgi:hypothetical protein
MLWNEVFKEIQPLNSFNIILFAIFITVFLVLLLMGHTLQNKKRNIMICNESVIEDYLY